MLNRYDLPETDGKIADCDRNQSLDRRRFVKAEQERSSGTS